MPTREEFSGKINESLRAAGVNPQSVEGQALGGIMEQFNAAPRRSGRRAGRIGAATHLAIHHELDE